MGVDKWGTLMRVKYIEKEKQSCRSPKCANGSRKLTQEIKQSSLMPSNVPDDI